MGGLFVEFELVRTAPSDRDASRRPGRRRRDPHTPPTPSGAPRATATLRATSIVTRRRREHSYPARTPSPRLRAGTGLLVWVTAISKYFDVAKNVGPRVA